MNKNLKKIPYGVFDYKKIVDNDYYYIDKTMYFEKLEDDADVLMYLRPGRFGKSLFTSILAYYYDINYKNEFKHLFKDTYVYKHPTKEKNSYYVLRLDFSAVSSSTKTNMMNNFNSVIAEGISKFNQDYNLNCSLDIEGKISSIIIGKFFTEFYNAKKGNKLYIIIDEYDNFTNAILKGDAKEFEMAVGKNGFIKDFYAMIKKYYGLGIVGRVFITGICPITMDCMTSGFNICTDISTNPNYNSMIGLTHNEVKQLLDKIDKSNKDKMFEIMKENYNGYKFNEEKEEKVFNATLVMYFLKKYIEFNKIPSNLIDNNIYMNYEKLENILKLYNNNFYENILEKLLNEKNINKVLKTKFSLMSVDEDTIVSLLYYFGYLTVNKLTTSGTNFVIPNKVVEEVYGSYFIAILKSKNIIYNNERIGEIINELISDGKIDKLNNYVCEILSYMSYRDFTKMSEKDIKVIYFTLLILNPFINVYSEREVRSGYTDIFIKPSLLQEGYNILIELKYIKESECSNKMVSDKVTEAEEQIIKYVEDYRIDKSKLRCYGVVYAGKNIKDVKEINVKE